MHGWMEGSEGKGMDGMEWNGKKGIVSWSHPRVVILFCIYIDDDDVVVAAVSIWGCHLTGKKMDGRSIEDSSE